MDDHEFDKLLSEGRRTITLEIPISDHVWRAFKRACEYTDNNGKPFSEEKAYGVHLEYAMESYISDIAKSEELSTFFMAEALQQVWAEKDEEQKVKQANSSDQKNAPSPGEGMK